MIDQNVFEKIGSFSETLGPTCPNLVDSGDIDLILKALNVIGKLRYFPAIVQYHYVDPLRFKLFYLILTNFQRNCSFTLSHDHESTRGSIYMI